MQKISGRSLLISFLSAFLSIVPIIQSTAVDSSILEERWEDKPGMTDGWVMWADDLFSEFNTSQYPYLTAVGTNGMGGGGSASTFESIAPCPDMYSGPCKDATNMEYYPFLKVCIVESDRDCIESMWVESGPQQISGKFKSYFPEDVKYEVDGTDRGSMKFDGSAKRAGDSTIPDGISGSLWTIDGVEPGKSTTFFVSARILGHVNRQGNQLIRNDERAQVSIDKISTISSFGKSPHVIFFHRDGRYAWSGAGPARSNQGSCLSADGTMCLLRERTPEGLRVGISLRLTNPLNSWLHGRFSNPVFSSRQANNSHLVTLTADYVRVPYIQESLSPEAKAKVCDPATMARLTLAPGFCNFNSVQNSRKFDEFATVSPYISQKADALVSSWRFVTKPGWNIGNSACSKPLDRLTGIVSTNATLYDSNAPQFSASEGTLNYRLGALHYTPSGDVFKGSYNLYLDANYAKCLWGLSSIPLSASISISGESSSVATTTMKVANGYVDFHADAFTFSAPTISIKLEDSKSSNSVIPKPSQSGSATSIAALATPQLSSQIMKCVKGSKVIKINLAKSRKCPAGYKKVN